MVQALIESIDDLKTGEQQDFIQNLFDHLDPFLPFLEQQSEKQLKWLEILHAFYIDGDEDAFEDV